MTQRRAPEPSGIDGTPDPPRNVYGSFTHVGRTGTPYPRSPSDLTQPSTYYYGGNGSKPVKNGGSIIPERNNGRGVYTTGPTTTYTLTWNAPTDLWVSAVSIFLGGGWFAKTVYMPRKTVYPKFRSRYGSSGFYTNIHYFVGDYSPTITAVGYNTANFGAFGIGQAVMDPIVTYSGEFKQKPSVTGTVPL